MVLKIIVYLIPVILLGFLTKPCDAVVFDDGHKLKKWCAFLETKSTDMELDSLNTGLCMGFVAGVLDWRSLTNTRGFCDIPSGVSLEQVTLVLNKYIREHPDKLNNPAADLVAWAVKEAWCIDKPNNKYKIYSVKSIESHYPHENGNSETTLIIYLKGSSGHVDEILCQFPPNQKVTADNIKKVQVKEISNKYMFGAVGYFCDPVP
jgi:hypothetical protein